MACPEKGGLCGDAAYQATWRWGGDRERRQELDVAGMVTPRGGQMWKRERAAAGAALCSCHVGAVGVSLREGQDCVQGRHTHSTFCRGTGVAGLNPPGEAPVKGLPSKARLLSRVRNSLEGS